MDPTKTGERIRSAMDNSGGGVPARFDPVMDLRSNVFSFFKDRMEKIQKNESLREKIQDALEDLVDSGSLNFDQLMTLFGQVSKDQATASDSIISLFRPVPGAPSILADNLSKDERPDPYEETFNNMDPEALRKIDAVYRFLQSHGEVPTEEPPMRRANEDPTS